MKQRETVGVLFIGQISSHIDCRSHLFWPGVVPVPGDLELRAMPVIPQLRLTKTGDRIIYKNGNVVLGWLEDFPFSGQFHPSNLELKETHRKRLGMVYCIRFYLNRLASNEVHVGPMVCGETWF